MPYHPTQYSDVTIRPYSEDDKNFCCEIFQSNVPQYFDETERADFLDFLDLHASGYYWVAEKYDQIVACGGIRIRNDRSGGLTYGMVKHTHHRSGIGKLLAGYRILKLLEHEDVQNITLDTSQHTYKFFEKFGFTVERIDKNFYGADLHSYSMRLSIPLDPVKRDHVKQNISSMMMANNQSATPPSPSPL